MKFTQISKIVLFCLRYDIPESVRAFISFHPEKPIKTKTAERKTQPEEEEENMRENGGKTKRRRKEIYVCTRAMP